MPSTAHLLHWYHTSKRVLPWRHASDPYLIWISEIILQQTRIEQGTDYFNRFTDRFPTVYDLAAASEEEVLLQWQGLGYYSRARNLLKAAKTVVDQFQGTIPNTASKLLTLSGIGPYTSAAISSIAFGEPAPAIDGNVMRVLSRYFTLPSMVNSTDLKKECHTTILSMMKEAHPGDVNQAIMELGAMICKPLNPRCHECPIQNGCGAFHLNAQSSFPVPAVKNKPRQRYFTFVVLVAFHDHKPYIIIRRRNDNDIWQGLFELPLIETATEPTNQLIEDSVLWKTLIDKRNSDLQNSFYLRHQLTHQTLHCRFIREETDKSPKELTDEGLKTIALTELDQYAFPRVITRYFQRVLLPLFNSRLSSSG